MEKPVVKLVIKDLITGDDAKSELSLTINKINLLEKKVLLKDSVIFNLNNKIDNIRSIVITKDDQLVLSQELSKRLERDLKKQKLKTKLTLGAGIAAAVAVLLIAN